jgi:phosphoenolpyruvate carboxylase
MPIKIEGNKRLRNNVRELGFTLGEILIEQGGRKLFNNVEKLRVLSKELRTHKKPNTIKKIKSVVGKLTPQESYNVIKAFSIYFILVNAADETNSIIEEKVSKRSKKYSDSYLKETINEIKESGLTKAQLDKLLSKIEIIPVFTAHPTEATRQTILKKILKISSLLLQKELQLNNDKEIGLINKKIKTEVILLWQTNEIRFSKIKVEDEVLRGLFFFTETVYKNIPSFYESLNNTFNELLNNKIDLPPIIKFGSWIGGDRDGHPFVTEDITKSTFELHKSEIIKLYMKDLNNIYEELSTSISLKKVNQKLLKSIKRDQKNMGISPTDSKFREPTEVYRAKLFLIYTKLSNCLSDFDDRIKDYSNTEQFIADLQLIKLSLVENDAQLIAEQLIDPLVYKVKTFGFHFVKLDIRQNAKLISNAIDEIFNKADETIKFHKLNEEEKIELLTREILSSRPLINEYTRLSNDTRKILNEFSLIKWGKENVSIEAAGDYIISNCSSGSHILSAALLAKEAGLIIITKGKVHSSEIDILPLFETISDLRNAQAVMKELLNNRAYKIHLQKRNNEQKIMLGYSDSNKDGGIVTSNFELYKAQTKLQRQMEDNQINLTLFHGRGGSISRGGGPVNRSILAQPQGTITGKIKITEQGEMISSKYLLSDNAIKNLTIMSSSVLTQTLRSQNKAQQIDSTNYVKQFENISEIAFTKYRELVTNKHFYEYFRNITPIDIIEKIEIGSRPVSRKKGGDISNLRAIPWVFSWTQNRQAISGWFGFGSAIENVINSKVISLKQLKAMYKNWTFFNALIQNIEMVLAKTDMIIAEEYVSLSTQKHIMKIFKEIKGEYAKSVNAIKIITGNEKLLDSNKNLQNSIALRNPYIDPISFIQVNLIKKYRTERNLKKKRELLNIIRSSVNGVAAGIRNTG